MLYSEHIQRRHEDLIGHGTVRKKVRTEPVLRIFDGDVSIVGVEARDVQRLYFDRPHAAIIGNLKVQV